MTFDDFEKDVKANVCPFCLESDNHFTWIDTLRECKNHDSYIYCCRTCGAFAEERSLTQLNNYIQNARKGFVQW